MNVTWLLHKRRWRADALKLMYSKRSEALKW